MKSVLFLFALSAFLLFASSLPLDLKSSSSLLAENDSNMDMEVANFLRNIQEGDDLYMDEDYLTSEMSEKFLKKLFKKAKKVAKKIVKPFRKAKKVFKKVKKYLKQIANCYNVIAKATKLKQYQVSAAECKVGKKKCKYVNRWCPLLGVIRPSECAAAVGLCGKISSICK